MQTFRFRLARVLDWYTDQMELEERRLHTCLAALTQVEQSIAALAAESLSIEREVVSHHSIPARELISLGLYRLGVKKRQADLSGKREQCVREVAEQRTRFQAAQRKVRLIEKLKERRLAEHAYAETRELEELASDAFFAKWANK